MFIKNSQTTTSLESKLYLAHREMIDQVNSIIKKNNTEEDIKGTSNKFYEAYDYYLLLALLVLIDNYIKNNVVTWETIQTKFNLECIKDQLYCKNIILNKYLEIWGFPKVQETVSKPIVSFNKTTQTTKNVTSYENPDLLIKNSFKKYCSSIIEGEERVNLYTIIPKVITTKQYVIMTDTKNSIKP